MSEEALIVNGIELNLKCYSCEQAGVRQPRLTSVTALRKHMKIHGKIINPSRHPSGGHQKKEDGT